MSDSPFARASQSILETAIANEHPGADPRPAQAELTGHIAETMEQVGHLAAEAGTGTGKAYALLAPAYAAAAIKGERTVVSTQSLALQSQILGSDAPAMAKATEQVTGTVVKLALLKGFTNYGCAKATLEYANKELDGPVTPDVLQRRAEARGDMPGTAWLLGGINEFERGILNPSINGERSSAEADIREEEWRNLSVSSDDCSASMPGGCDWAKEGKCFVKRAVEEARNADIVVTNHAMLGVQAATNIPAVMGRPNEDRPFSHLMVDECHSLADAVRNQASEVMTPASFGGRLKRIDRLVREAQNSLTSFGYITGYLNRVSASLDAFPKMSEDMVMIVESEFRIAATRKPQDRNDFLLLGIEDGIADSPFTQGKALRDWMTNYQMAIFNLLEPVAKTVKEKNHGRKDEFVEKAIQNLTRAGRSLDKLIEIFTVLDAGNYPVPDEDGYDEEGNSTGKPVIVPNPNIARWISFNEISRGQWEVDSFQYAMVDVSSNCQSYLWQYSAPMTGTHELSVTCLSATIDRDSFLAETGLQAPMINTYRSPFDQAYVESMAYIPVAKPTDPDWSQLVSQQGFFDVRRHSDWCSARIVELVQANRGHALVLCATRLNAEKYVAALSAAGVQVYSHLDTTARQAVLTWKANPGSVLVGLKSLMTGVDAPGEECSLVILDRPPRSPMNALDEQRTKIAGDVYVSDTVTLIRQAVGRLIRKTTDRGLVAILDPRVSDETDKSIRYKAISTRAKYRNTVRDFGRITHDREEALNFLRKQSEGRPEITPPARATRGGFKGSGSSANPPRKADGSIDFHQVFANLAAKKNEAQAAPGRPVVPGGPRTEPKADDLDFEF